MEQAGEHKAPDNRGGVAANRLAAYLASEFGPDGQSLSSPDNVQFYYKIPATFGYEGQRRLALRSLEQFAARFMPDGVLDLSHDPFAEPWTPYIAGWAAWGACALGRFDIARRLNASAAGYGDVATGGYKTGRDAHAPRDIQRTGAALMGLVWAGDLERAQAAAGFMRIALDRQPAPERGFHAQLDAEGGILVNEGDRNCFFGLDDAYARPAMFATGIAGLVWLHRRTGDEGALATARDYLRLILAHRGDPATLPLATKIGWAALMVHAHAPDPALADFARRAAEAQIADQQADGAIGFSHMEGAPAKLDKVWMVGWGCDSLLTLLAVADGAA